MMSYLQVFVSRMSYILASLFCGIFMSQNISVGFHEGNKNDQFVKSHTNSLLAQSNLYEQQIRKTNTSNIKIKRSGPFGNNYVVPVVFHIISQNPDAITDQQIINAVSDLNDAFAHTGAYAAGGPGANTGITFCLAKIDPDGGITNGITRTKSVLGDFDKDMEDDRLKDLVSWDTKQYCNIWLVDSIRSENVSLTGFSCGKWSRLDEGGYAGLSPGGDYRDGIVITAFGTLLAHEMGHYLGLQHTFVRGNCTNNNCATDGDGICDTPPQSVLGGSCTTPQNSCSTDTLSGFSKDVPDLNSNFMSYSGSCTNEFTEGQAAKMRGVLDTVRNSLLIQNKCSPPCTENILANFTRDNWSPVNGDNINFTSTSTGAANYQWSIDGIVVGSNSPVFNTSFNSPGKYKVTLKVYNTNPSCYSTYSDFIIVNCGVMARFYPDKRLIASKDNIYPDSIFFKNRSVNASSYKWLMSNDQGMSEQLVSTDFDLNYTFLSPGKYSVSLIASNGSCTDETEKFNFTVADPTQDGTISFTEIECYQQTKIKISLNICNNGYAPIPNNIPVSFYDGDPRTDTANLIGTPFLLPDTIPGKCCGKIYTYIIDVHKPGLNHLCAVFNDNGSTKPVKLPNTSMTELNYTNNFIFSNGFQFRVTVNPDTATLEPGDTLQLTAIAGPGSISSYLWINPTNLNCSDCPNPVFIAGKKDATEKVIATSDDGCIDSSFAEIKVPPADDYTITIDSIYCSAVDSLRADFTICNNFKWGGIPESLKVSFYDADPTTTRAKLLGPVFITTANDTGKCVSYSHVFRGIESGKVFAAVNDNGISVPVHFPEDSNFLEKDYTNNITSFTYKPDTVSIYPNDTTVVRDQTFQIRVISPVPNSSSITWFTGDGYTLSCYNCIAPSATVITNSIIQMQILTQSGCVTKGTARIKVVTGGRVNIPNAFTPNSDGRNDIFYVMAGKDVKMLKDFSIYNRWGQKIFQVSNASPNDPAFGWNGNFGGKASDAGTYVYLVTVVFNDGSEQLYKGTVTLIR